MFHNVIINKFVMLVVLLNSELYYNLFVTIFFLPLVPLHDKTTAKLVLLNFLFDFFDYLFNFLTMFDIYRMLLNFTLRFVLLILFMYILYLLRSVPGLSFRDAG